jgi:hypothetical protein
MTAITPAERARDEALTYVAYLAEDDQERWRQTEGDAELMLRRLANRHGCTRTEPDDPPCTHPQHDADQEFSRLARDAMGLLPAPPPPPADEQPAAGLRRATCEWCGRLLRLLADGRLLAHSRRCGARATDRRCPGSHQHPGKATT